MSVKTMMTKVLLASALSAMIPALASAGPITPFSLFGGNNAALGTNVTVNSGLVGSNGGVSLGGGSDTLTVMGAGILSGGTSLNINAGGDIIFNGNVTLSGSSHTTGDIDSGGNVVIGTNAIVDGNIRAGGTVTVSGGALVKGNIDAGALAGVAVTLGTNTDVDGTITRNAGTTTSYSASATYGASVTGSPAAPTSYITTGLPGATVFSSGVVSHNLAGGSTLTLAPGSYNDIILGTNSVLNLSAGAYYFDTWNLSGGIDVNFDLTGGDVLLFFTGNVSLGTGSLMNLTGGDASNIYAETYGDWSLSGGGQWFGTIYGSGANSDITFGTNTDLTGALWATRNLDIAGGSTVNYILADHVAPVGDTQIAAVPEPATLGLLALGLLGVGARFRARRK